MMSKQQLPFAILVLGHMKQSAIDRQGVSGFCCAFSDLWVKTSNLLLTECLARLPKLHVTASSEVQAVNTHSRCPICAGTCAGWGTGDTQGQFGQNRFIEGLGSR